jgi:hypothetical protein
MTTPGTARKAGGDDPFLPEQELLWWLPRAGVALAVLLAVVLSIVSIVHRQEVRLTVEDGTVVLERGRLAPRGWTPWVPDGAVVAWRPVPWPDAPAAPLAGDLEELAETFEGILRAAAAEPGADLARYAAQEDALAAWHRRRFERGLPGEGSVSAMLRAWEAPALEGKAYNQARRVLLQDAERLLSSLPEEGDAEQARDRAALRGLIDAMDTPAR